MNDFNNMRFLSFFLVLILLSASSAFSQSAVQMNNYPPKDITVQVESSNLPLGLITTTDTLSRYTRSLGRMKIINNADGVNYSDTVTYSDQTRVPTTSASRIPIPTRPSSTTAR